MCVINKYRYIFLINNILINNSFPQNFSFGTGSFIYFLSSIMKD